MSVEDVSVVDGMGLDKESGEIVLLISDHLDWADEQAHLAALQAKANVYLDFVRSGQVYEASSAPAGTPVRIDVVTQYEVPDAVRWFFEGMDDAVEKHGITLTTRMLPAGYRA